MRNSALHEEKLVLNQDETQVFSEQDLNFFQAKDFNLTFQTSIDSGFRAYIMIGGKKFKGPTL